MIHVRIEGGQAQNPAIPVVTNMSPLDSLQASLQTVLAVGLAQVTVFTPPGSGGGAPAIPNVYQFWLRNVSAGGQIITLHPAVPIDRSQGKWLYPGEEWASFPNWGLGMQAIANAAGGLLERAVFQT